VFKTTLDQYLNAVTKHDLSTAPLFLGFRQTENAAVVKPGIEGRGLISQHRAAS
jgi:hypothetical protein